MSTGRLIQMASGVLVEEDVLNVIKKLQEYDPNIRVKYLNPEARQEVSDAPYAIFELCPDGLERLIFSTWELDDRVLQRLYAADNVKNNILQNITDNNAAIKEAQTQRYREKSLEVVDVMKHAFMSPKGQYSFEIDGKKIEITDDPNRKAKITPVKED